MIKQPDIFDLYDGGGIDVACLGGAEFDRGGNVNVSRFEEKIPGPGGFINITQCAKKVCFMGSFTAGESDIRPENGRLRIVKDGTICKFRCEVQHLRLLRRVFQPKRATSRYCILPNGRYSG